MKNTVLSNFCSGRIFVFADMCFCLGFDRQSHTDLEVYRPASFKEQLYIVRDSASFSTVEVALDDWIHVTTMIV